MDTRIKDVKGLDVFSAAMVDRLSESTAQKYCSIYRRMLSGNLRVRSRAVWLQCDAVLTHARGLRLISHEERFGVPTAWSAGRPDANIKIIDKIMTVEAFEAALTRIRPGGRKRPQVALIARIAFYGGLRAAEVLALRPADVEYGRILQLSVKGKGSKHRLAYLPHSMTPQFEGFSGFDIGYHAVSGVIGAAGIQGLHSLRHSFATRMVSLGVNIGELQMVLGHKNIEMTARYLNLSGGLPASMKALGYEESGAAAAADG